MQKLKFIQQKNFNAESLSLGFESNLLFETYFDELASEKLVIIINYCCLKSRVYRQKKSWIFAFYLFRYLFFQGNHCLAIEGVTNELNTILIVDLNWPRLSWFLYLYFQHNHVYLLLHHITNNKPCLLLFCSVYLFFIQRTSSLFKIVSTFINLSIILLTTTPTLTRMMNNDEDEEKKRKWNFLSSIHPSFTELLETNLKLYFSDDPSSIHLIDHHLNDEKDEFPTFILILKPILNHPESQLIVTLSWLNIKTQWLGADCDLKMCYVLLFFLLN